MLIYSPLLHTRIIEEIAQDGVYLVRDSDNVEAPKVNIILLKIDFVYEITCKYFQSITVFSILLIIKIVFTAYLVLKLVLNT